MIDKSYNFDHKMVVVNGYAIRQKFELVDEISHLLAINDYVFHPLFRPVPSAIKNYKDLSYSYLAIMLRHIYEYCVCFPYACLGRDVIVCGDGVHEHQNESRCVIVEELADDWFNAYPLPLSQVAYSVRAFFDKGLSNARVIVY